MRVSAAGLNKAKLEVERIVESSGLPWTILRATQFYSYCFENSRKLARFPLVASVPGGFRGRPWKTSGYAHRILITAIPADQR